MIERFEPRESILDHAATTPVLPRSPRGDGAQGFDAWANPAHRTARAAPRALARGSANHRRSALGWRHDVIFTSGASEAVEIVADARPHCRPRVARPSMPSSRTRWGRLRPSFRSDADGLIDEAALDAVLGRGSGADRDPEGQQRDRVSSSRSTAWPAHPRSRIAAARRLRARRGQDRRCLMPISSLCRRTSSAARRGRRACWCATSPR